MTEIRTRRILTPTQTSVLVALNRMLEAARLILACPRCLLNGGSKIEGTVSASQAHWSLNCDCTERQMSRADVREMDADAELFASAEDVLRPLSLVIRCAEARCVTQPLELERAADGLIVRCPCAKTTFRLTRPTLH